MEHKMNKRRYFIVEGNIGAGKSTFIKMLVRYLNIQVVLEPHEQWQNIGEKGDNLLDLFYRDPKRWAYSFQTYAFGSRIMAYHANTSMHVYSVQVLERSVFSDRYCFAYNCYELGYMNELEWQLYQTWFGWMIDSHVEMPDGFIYLKTDPEICYQRLIKRGRQEESGVTLEYIKGIHAKHERWLIEKCDLSPAIEKVPVLVLDCNAEFETDSAEQMRHVEAVSTFVLSCIPTEGAQLPTSMTSPQKSL